MSFAFYPVRGRSCRLVQHPFAEGNRSSVWLCATAAFVLLLLCLVIHGVAAAQVKPTRRILILNEVNPSYPAIAVINQGIQTALSNSPYRLEFYSEYLDTVLFPDPAVQQEFRDFYLRKYRNRQPDVIITVGSSPLKFMQEAHKSAFPGVPIVFCLPVGDAPSALELGSDFTGVKSDMAPAETLEIALRLQPGTEHVVVVSGLADWDKRQEDILKQQIKGLTDHVDITYLADLAVPEQLERLRHLPRHTVVLILSIAKDANGTQFKSNEIAPLVAVAANAPVFSLYDVYLNHGEVGGYLSNLNEQGEVAGGMALKILRGDKAQNIPRVKGVNTYMFDWRAVKRWGLKEGEIPPGSIVLNRQPGFWELYKQYVLIGILVLLTQSMAILGLLWQRAGRRRTEAELRKSEEKFAKSFRQSPLAVTISSANDSRYLEVNETFERQTGWSRDEIIGRTPFDLHLWVDPDERVAFMKELDQTSTVRDLEFRFRRKDGQIRTALGSSELIEVNRERCALSVATDITERKEAEEAIAALTGRLIDAQEQERKRIARELHDDYNQRLAMLAIDLEQVAEDDESGGIEISQYLRQLSKHASKLADDLHSLSHQLHSSALNNLGLVAGVESFCEEFEEQQGIKVDFTHKNVPRDVPEDLALCLFRVTQEALRNVKRHSGANRAEVHLEWLDGKLQLKVSDRGRGFDSNKRATERGIGIQSMEERLRALGGSFEVRSQPMNGTRVGAWLPLEVDDRRIA